MAGLSEAEKARKKPSLARKRRGYETQRFVASAWRGDGWPYAEPIGSGMQGRDITGTPGIAIEVKAVAAFNPAAWLRQASRNADADIPVVILRPNGGGEATIDDWPCVVSHTVLRKLLRAAGYGDNLFAEVKD